MPKTLLVFTVNEVWPEESQCAFPVAEPSLTALLCRTMELSFTPLLTHIYFCCPTVAHKGRGTIITQVCEGVCVDQCLQPHVSHATFSSIERNPVTPPTKTMMTLNETFSLMVTTESLHVCLLSPWDTWGTC